MKRAEELTQQDRLIHSLEMKLQQQESLKTKLDAPVNDSSRQMQSDICGNFEIKRRSRSQISDIRYEG